MAGVIRLIIIEDHPVVGAGMSEVLARGGLIDVVGVAVTLETGIVLIER